MEKDYSIEGYIKIPVEFDILANSKEDAIAQAIEAMKDEYNLDVIGYSHKPEEVKFILNAIEYEEDND